ncbi:hypothetical protein BGZ68_008193 [Mortierella alpina]|nr:hypothetical protein BGZ68_008193 [Mortierella alpina]
MELTSSERARPAGARLRRPNYGPMEQAFRSSSSRRTVVDLDLFEQMHLTSIEVQPSATLRSDVDRDTESSLQNSNKQLEQQTITEAFIASRKRTSINDNQLEARESVNLPTTPKKQKTGLRRRNIGAMGEVIFGRDLTTSPTIRRPVADEDLLDILNLSRPGKDQDKVTDNQLAEKLDSALLVSAPQTPRRESTSHTTPRRRTPRRRSKPMNPNVKPSAFKAMADAHQARINKLIHEATRFGQSGREKHSPINILRALSRVPGFNQPRKPSPEREPIPGSDQWKKLTPKTPKTMHFQTPSDRDLVPAAPNFGTEKRSSTLDRNAMSVEKRLAFDKFRDNNPFLDPEDFNKLWEAELSIGRNQRFSGRGSFGMGIAGEEVHGLLDDDDTREHRLSQHDMTDPFLHQIELEERPLHLEDLTTGSLHGVDNEQKLGQGHGEGDERAKEVGAQSQGVNGSMAEPASSGMTTDPESLSTGSEAPGITLALSMSQQGSEAEQTLSADQALQQQQGMPRSTDLDTRDIQMHGDAGDVHHLVVEQQIDENLEEEGWEDIPDDENERGVLDSQDQQQQPIAEVEHAEGLVNEFFDMTMAQQENDQDQQGHPMEEQPRHTPDMDLEEQPGSELAGQMEGDQEVFEEDYVHVPDEDHVELQEHEERQGPSGVQYFDDFPSELGIMSNGNVLPTIFPKTKKTVRRVSQEAMAVIMEGSHQFLEQASNDLAAYAEHAGRRTIDESDVELLMDRLRLTNDKVSLESLLHRYLPRELRDKVLFPDEMQRFRRS